MQDVSWDTTKQCKVALHALWYTADDSSHLLATKFAFAAFQTMHSRGLYALLVYVPQ